MRPLRPLIGALCAVLWLLAEPAAWAGSSAAHKAKRPDLFHPETGLRIARQRGPTPDDVPGAARISAAEARDLIAKGAVALDVGAAAQSHYDALDGTWLVDGTHRTIPGAVWLPETGRGTLTPEMKAYLASNLKRLTEGDTGRPLVVFCIADCWMSWNATQRITALGYTKAHWFAEGTDGWLDMGWNLAPADPVPVQTD